MWHRAKYPRKFLELKYTNCIFLIDKQIFKYMEYLFDLLRLLFLLYFKVLDAFKTKE